MRLVALFRTASFKLTAAYVLLFTFSVGVLAFVVYARTTAEYQRQARVRIFSEAQTLHKIYDVNGLSEVLASIHDRLRSPALGGLEYTVFTSAGERVFGNLAHVAAKEGWTDDLGPPDGDEQPGQLERLAIYTIRLSPNEWLSVADDAGKFEEFGRIILQSFGWMLGLTLLLAVAGGAALSMGVLSRIQAINTTAEAIIGGDINSRIPLDKTGDELDRLSVTLNRMLDRIANLMDALRQVSSNIAHDLRTPLGRLRHTLDEAREKARNVDDYKLAVTTAISDTDLVLETFSALLRIAQIESGSRRAGFRQLDMAGVVESVVQTYQLIAEDSGRHLKAQAAPGVAIAGDHELLTQLLVNLVENAIRHTPPGSTISLDLIAAPIPELVVSDNGPGIPESERARVLARFHRLENSRTSPGSGLGLSIVAAIAELHDINLTLEDNAPGLRVRLRLPRSAEKSFAPAAVAAD